MKIKTIILIFLYALIVNGQNFEKVIGHFSKAGSFSIIQSGLIYVADLNKDELYKLDETGKILFLNGGYGWDSGSFDNPVDVYATTLRVYVADKNNDRIQIFDKYLNFMSSFSSDNLESEESFAYPTGFGISNQGDYFILDSDNGQILKYDLNGNYLFNIGYNDAGKYLLSAPKALAISSDGKVFVINNKQILVFDQYGTGLLKLNPGFSPKNINITNNFLTVNSDSLIEYTNLSSVEPAFIKFKPTEIDINSNAIQEAAIFNNKIYVLTEKNIMIYSIK